MQGKLHETLAEHEGQLFASMYSCREDYMRLELGKRKRAEDPMKEVRILLPDQVWNIDATVRHALTNS